MSSWQNDGYKRIKITGGDTKNPSLKSWLDVNAEETSEMDLSGKRWEFTQTPNLSSFASLAREFDLDFNFDDGTTYSNLSIGGNYIVYENLLAYGQPITPPTPPTPPAPVGPYIVFTSEENFTLEFNPSLSSSSTPYDGVLEYSTDMINWNNFIRNTSIDGVLDDNLYCVYIRGTGNTYVKGMGAVSLGTGLFKLTGTDIRCSGNIENILDYQSVLDGLHPTLADQAFVSLFNGQSALISAPDLLCPNLSAQCYYSMFYNCGLIEIPHIGEFTSIPNNAFQQIFFSCNSLANSYIDLTNITTISNNAFSNYHGRAYQPELYLGTALTSLGTSAFSGGAKLHFLFREADTPQFDVSRIVTPASSDSKTSITYTIYTDNTVIKNAVLAKANEKTTVYVYHIDGSDW